MDVYKVINHFLLMTLKESILIFEHRTDEYANIERDLI